MTRSTESRSIRASQFLSLSFIMPRTERAIVRCRDDDHIHPSAPEPGGCRALHIDGHQQNAAIHYAKLCREDGI